MAPKRRQSALAADRRHRKSLVTKALRRNQRADIGRLSNTLIKPYTAQLYTVACEWFFSWMFANNLLVPIDTIEFDDMVAEAIESAWEEGESRALVGNVLSGLEHFVTGLRGSLKRGWKLWRQWGLQELPDRAPPLSLEGAMAMAGVLWDRGWLLEALLLVFAFDAFLRTSEFMSVLRGQITFGRQRGIMHWSLPATKSSRRKGGPEGVAFELSPYVEVFELLVANLLPGDKVCHCSQAHFRKAFDAARLALGVCGDIKPYSLRRGGATEFCRSTGWMAKTMERGRWSEMKIARIYVNTAMAELHSLRVDKPRLDRACVGFHRKVERYAEEMVLGWRH